MNSSQKLNAILHRVGGSRELPAEKSSSTIFVADAPSTTIAFRNRDDLVLSLRDFAASLDPDSGRRPEERPPPYVVGMFTRAHNWVVRNAAGQTMLVSEINTRWINELNVEEPARVADLGSYAANRLIASFSDDVYVCTGMPSTNGKEHWINISKTNTF